ncbi:MAG: hypothetical protein ACWGO1_04735 [Anaerolineales bacterium]
MDGNLKIFFQWQNPVLRESIYPFRIEKLTDFLRTYYEIDALEKFKQSDQTDPAILQRIRDFSTALQNEHRRLDAELSAGIERMKQADKWFDAITASNEKNLRFKRLYYLDRQIQSFTDQHADLLSRQENLRKRVNWYEEGDTRRNLWLERAAELDAPAAELKAKLDELQALRVLFDQQERLPELDDQGMVSPRQALRWQVLSYQKELEGLSHTELIERIVQRFDQEPARFEKWLQYMIIHFSGMRYRSAHASWADPKYLLELLTREWLRSEIQGMDDDALQQAIQEAVEELKEERQNLQDEVKIRAVDTLIAKLNFWLPRRSLLEYRMAREIGEIENLPNDERVYLEKIKALKKRIKAGGDEMPDWAWDEITKYTQLRLKTQDKDWEKISPERWKYEDRRWREILDAWERRDITGWRKHHQETLDLIVTRAVCNEIAEHIQHLRGLVPFAGLTGKPKWYLNWQGKTQELPLGDPAKAYLVQAPAESDFVCGASILWLDWVENQPNAWQIAQPLPGYDIPPEGVRLTSSKSADTVEWSYHRLGRAFERTRRKPSIRELRKQGRTKKEIEAIREEMRMHGGFVKNYLRWTHEATVVSVEELLDGKYVLTFETGQIGLVLRRLSDLVGNNKIFAGYIPKSDREPENLDAMLDRKKILPG